jgi:uncharacterized membrane protein YvlD (DUF360 family)
MKRRHHPAVRFALRLLLVWAVQGVLLWLLIAALPGFSINRLTPGFLAREVLAALVIGIANLAVGPALIALRIPLNMATAGITLMGVNFALLVLAAQFVPDFQIRSLVQDGLIGAVLLSIANTVLTAFVAMDDDYGYMQFALGALRQQGARAARLRETSTERGMVLLEIDGLSYKRMQGAMKAGWMPAVSQLVERGSHCLLHFDCGLPSQTSSAQAGILFGDNRDIPSFRWYDKRARRMIVSNHLDDARAINDHFSNGRGLLRGGVSINNMMNGDAARSLLTLSTLSGHPRQPTERATDVLNAFWLNPYTFARAIALSIVDLFRELFQALRQSLRNEAPRINRLAGGYPFLRILTNVFLRDLSTFAVMQEIIRGAPIIYTTFVGYDEVAHHAGPDTPDALGTLRGYDQQVRHVLQTIDQLAPMPYDLFLLSDHGHSAGATFKQRYGQTLAQFIDALTRPETSVEEMKTAEAGRSFVRALTAELQAASAELAKQPNTRIRRASMRATARTLGEIGRVMPAEKQHDAEVVVCASGGLAHLYFNTLGSDKVCLDDIEKAHPQLIQSLVNHEGIGFVVGYDDDGDVLVLGKRGARNVSDGTVSGEDPLAPFGDVSVRAEQVLRLARFQSAGDLILNSALFPDGTVAAFEELVGSHGGLGGQQTDAFLLHPCADHVKDHRINNAYQVYALLERWKNAHRSHAAV